jgi:hypothetical protein
LIKKNSIKTHSITSIVGTQQIQKWMIHDNSKVCLRIPESTYVEFCMDLFWLMWIAVILGQPEFDLQDIPLFVVTSLSAGVLGACLNRIHDWLCQYRPSSRHKSLRFYWNSFSLWLPKAHTSFISTSLQPTNFML